MSEDVEAEVEDADDRPERKADETKRVGRALKIVSLLCGADSAIANNGSSNCRTEVSFDVEESLPCFGFDRFDLAFIRISPQSVWVQSQSLYRYLSWNIFATHVPMLAKVSFGEQ